MTFDLGLVHNFSVLDLAAGFNQIYPGHVTVSITIMEISTYCKKVLEIKVLSYYYSCKLFYIIDCHQVVKPLSSLSYYLNALVSTFISI